MLILEEMIKIKKQGILTIPIILTVVAILAIVVVAAYKVRNGSIGFPTTPPVESPKTQELKTFQSKAMKFNIQIPKQYQIEEKPTVVNVISQNNTKISISREGTNFKNLRDYLDDLDKQNKIKVLNKTEFTFNNYETFMRTEKYGDGNAQGKTYYIFIDNSVYTLSTSTPSLYPVLDQIAQSFRYIP